NLRRAARCRRGFAARARQRITGDVGIAARLGRDQPGRALAAPALRRTVPQSRVAPARPGDGIQAMKPRPTCRKGDTLVAPFRESLTESPSLPCPLRGASPMAGKLALAALLAGLVTGC